MPFPTSAACRFLDLPPVNLRMLERIKITPRPAREGENADCSKQLAKWNYIIQPRSEAEQETAKRLDWEEIIAEKTRVKRKYNKNSKESN